MRKRQLAGSVELRINQLGKIAIAPNPDFFVTEEEQKTVVNGKEVLL